MSTMGRTPEFWWPERTWDRPSASVSLGSATITRVVTDDPDPNFKPRAAGFTAEIRPVEPQLWEGDGA